MEKMIKILIADDNESILNYMEKVFSKIPNFHVIGRAKNGEEALNSIIEHKPDVVVTDNDMPKYSGIEVIEKIKNDSNNPKFIIVSGDNNKELIEKSIRLGVIRCFSKPIKDQEIINEIQKLFSFSKTENDGNIRANKSHKSVIKRIKKVFGLG